MTINRCAEKQPCRETYLDGPQDGRKRMLDGIAVLPDEENCQEIESNVD